MRLRPQVRSRPARDQASFLASNCRSTLFLTHPKAGLSARDQRFEILFTPGARRVNSEILRSPLLCLTWRGNRQRQQIVDRLLHCVRRVGRPASPGRGGGADRAERMRQINVGALRPLARRADLGGHSRRHPADQLGQQRKGPHRSQARRVSAWCSSISSCSRT